MLGTSIEFGFMELPIIRRLYGKKNINNKKSKQPRLSSSPQPKNINDIRPNIVAEHNIIKKYFKDILMKERGVSFITLFFISILRRLCPNLTLAICYPNKK